ncbi:TonB-dependent receptor [Allomuricauda sp. SCSIO 65647]|uniref:TonB-dependent receptor n=1 Tax=Allomuricauda sp. SCSIO 65647 TaxID=2908843 RepID=UPI001F1B2169|nr:TonB-dependent receptor [Muricauda sp. SCSIO 65647]UJH66404.1 TonB-dependent receptor [Muricauda sp. SCSIO 65647]
MKNLAIALFSIGILNWCGAQTITQTVKGSVTDENTSEALIGATITLVGSDPILGTITDFEGAFALAEVPVGRQDFEVRMIGYESYLVSEILVGSGKEVVLDITLTPLTTNLDEVVVAYRRNKEKPINTMAALSTRQFTVEETQRYAGGLNDPGRLVSSFAGVAAPSVSSNGISIRGNSPSGLLWRIEGVEVPSPNHFADLTIAGAGALTVLSSQVMGNSDFYTGAFPSEYGNATSGVFDINLRKGNSTNREYTFQASLLGLDFATEGPFTEDGDATYLFNYRYSTLGLIGAFLPSDAGVLKYQDLSFKLNMPTKNSGTFSFWGVGAYDGVDTEAEDMEEWESRSDRENSQTSLYMFASGLNHKHVLRPRSVINSTLSIAGNGTSFKEQYVADNLSTIPQSDARKNNYKLTLQSNLTSFFNERHTNRSGFYLNWLAYDLQVDDAETVQSLPRTIVDEDGQSYLLQFYSQSKFDLSTRWTLTAGFHSQYFGLNKEFTLEPRVSLDYKLGDKSNLALGYGLHSSIEPLSIYFVRDEDGFQPNKDLDLMKSNHFVLSFNTKISDKVRLSIEPYYQSLYDVPVEPNGYISTLNVEDNLFFDSALVSEGTGRNIGVDLTLERYLNNGFYYLFTTSIFDSKYTANDGIERNTRYNKNYVLNAVFGKEWQVGKNRNNTFGANFRLNYLGGNRIEAIDSEASIMSQDVVYGETGNQISFSEKHKDLPIGSFTLTYRKNRPSHSSVWSLQVLNAGATEEFQTDVFNTNTQNIERKFSGIVIPNISYKIEF